MAGHAVHLGIYDGLADWEVGYAIAHIRDPQWQRDPGRFTVVTVAETLDPVTTAGGLRILPDQALADLDPAASAMLILPGAGTWHEKDGNAAFGRAARALLDAGTPVAAICGATFGLAREGLLDSRAHTSSAPEYLAMTGYAGAEHYRRQPAVAEGSLITASPTAPVEFAREVLATLGVYEPAVLELWYRLYGQQDASAYWELANTVPH